MSVTRFTLASTNSRIDDMADTLAQILAHLTAPAHATVSAVAEKVESAEVAPVSALVWGTAKTHGLQIGDALMYGGKVRKAAQNVRRGVVAEYDRHGIKVAFDDAVTLTHIGFGATRFWAEKLTPAPVAVPEAATAKAAPARTSKAKTAGTVSLKVAAKRVAEGAKPFEVMVKSSTTGEPIPYGLVLRAQAAAAKAAENGTTGEPAQASTADRKAKAEAVRPVNRAMSKLLGKYTPEQWAGRFGDKALLKAALATLPKSERDAVKPYLAGLIAKATATGE